MARGCARPIRSMVMAISKRDRRALQWGGAGLALWLALQLVLLPAWDRWQQARAALPLRETTLIKYRQALAAIDSDHQTAEVLQARLRETESGLLQSATAALAAAEFQDWVRQALANRQIEMRSSAFLPVRPQSNGYTEVPLGVQFQCRLDQLVDFLTDVRSGPKLVTIPRLQIQSSGDAEKLLTVSLTVAGVMRSEAGRTTPQP